MKGGDSPGMVALKAEWAAFRRGCERVTAPVLAISEGQKRYRDTLLAKAEAKAVIRRAARPMLAEAEFERVRREILVKRGIVS